jgi:hypothetical protein
MEILEKLTNQKVKLEDVAINYIKSIIGIFII